MSTHAIVAPRLLTPEGFREHAAVLIDDGRITKVVDATDVPASYRVKRLSAGTLIPGFIDLQVNGGGGILFNDQPTVAGISAIAAAHRKLGTTAMLPTLISDDLSIVAQGIAAVDAAIEQGVPGILGIHVEGPFLNVARKGIHDASKFSIIDDDAIDLLSSLRNGKILVTLAPECTTPAMVAKLVDRGVIVSAGHTTASYEVMGQAVDAGLTSVTHLFNAMPPLSGREPGVIGAALSNHRIYAGIIADGHHVAAENLHLALRAKSAERLYLISDAMPTVGTNLDGFKLGDVEISVDNGRCVDGNGTLAGCHLDMASALRGMIRSTGCSLQDGSIMTSHSPASLLGISDKIGSIKVGHKASFVLIDDNYHVISIH